MPDVPVIAIDGPSASGKGTVAQLVAERLGFHYLDSGAMYRAAALAAVRSGLPLGESAREETALAKCASAMDLLFHRGRVFLDGADVSVELRSEAVGRDASRIAALPQLRAALLARQRTFRRAPGLVADGRDMASVVFPDARLKVFLTAQVAERARRRALQLKVAKAQSNSPKGLMEKENSATIRAPFEAILAAVTADLLERDRRDVQRGAAPLVCVTEARQLDTTGMSIQEAVETVCHWYQASAGDP